MILLLFISCKSYEIRYEPTDKDFNLKATSNILKPDEIFLTFTRDYDSTGVKLIQNDSIIFDGALTSQKGKSQSFKIDKSMALKIIFDNIKMPLLLSPAQMSDYKFVYVYKNQKKVYIQFYDGPKNLYSDTTFFKSFNEKKVNCKIMNIDSTSNFYYINIEKRNFFSKNKDSMIIVPKQDTIISNLSKITIGKIYRLRLNDSYYKEIISEMKKTKEEVFYYEEGKQIWDRKSNREFYTTDNLINLYYKKE